MQTIVKDQLVGNLQVDNVFTEMYHNLSFILLVFVTCNLLLVRFWSHSDSGNY